MADEEYEERGQNTEEDSKGSAAPILAVLGLLFVPALILAAFYYGMLRIGHLKRSVIVTTILIVDFFALIYFALSDALNKFTNALNNLTGVTNHWHDFIPLLMVVNIIIGGVAGYIFVHAAVKEMDNNPYLLTLKGSWMYGFEFRRTPRELWKRKQIVERLKNGSYVTAERSPLGLDENAEYRPAFRYASEARRHMFIIGGTGSGKTITMQSLIKADIDMGSTVVATDMKNNPDFAAKLAAWAAENDAEFYHFVNGKAKNYDIPQSPGQAFYDPLNSGSNTRKADMLLGLREWDANASVYKEDMKHLLQVLFNALENADQSKAPSIDWDHGNIALVYSALDKSNLAELAIACEGTPVQGAIEEIHEQYEDARKRGRLNQGVPNAIVQLHSQMGTIINSEYGPWMRTVPGKRNINVFELTKPNRDKSAVILFSLNSDTEPEFAKYVGSMIMSDLSAVSVDRRNLQLDNQCGIYIDEFQTLNITTVTGLLEKARDAYMAITLAQQSLEQVIVASPANGTAQLNAIMDVCSNYIVHAGSTHDSAERLSKLIGQEEYEEYSANGTRKSGLFKVFSNKNKGLNVGSKTKLRWKFGPEKFMNLSIPDSSNGFKTTAVLVNKSSADPAFVDRKGGMARELRMIPPDDVLKKYYFGALDENKKSPTTKKETHISLDKEEIESTTSTVTGGATPLHDAPMPTVKPVKRGSTKTSAKPKVTTVSPEDDWYAQEAENMHNEYDDDGSFTFEELDDDAPVIEGFSNEPLDFSQLSNLGTSLEDDSDTTSKKAEFDSTKRSNLKESKFTIRERERKEAEAAARRKVVQDKQRKAASSDQVDKSVKAPVRPSKASSSEGLPLPSKTAKTPLTNKVSTHDSDEEEIALPSLDDLF